MESGISLQTVLVAVTDTIAATLSCHNVLLVAVFAFRHPDTLLLFVFVGEFFVANFNHDHRAIELLIFNCHFRHTYQWLQTGARELNTCVLFRIAVFHRIVFLLD